ncbi:IS3 family transposase [Alicyclobacillus fastidiosus]
MTFSNFEELSEAPEAYMHFYNHEPLLKGRNGLSPMECRAKAV